MEGWIQEMDRFFILNDEKQPEAVDVFTWSKWFFETDRHVGFTEIEDLRVSTVFVGLPLYHPDNPHYGMFEMIVFHGEESLEQLRYSTWEEAEAGHKLIVEEIKEKGVNKWKEEQKHE